ncbi:Abi family protein [uncultured Pseudokineococcus sp.]|uniref:Abi family protein n=1 Tax=uncultured Pseudokineococcus sp. TaxID=1642928 RepID=UPI002617B1B8|nr:Abi family protein [uncultured Pseudokineococcus sp.]
MTLDELVARLADRGLSIPDPDRARRYLRHIGYYRLSPYAIPFQQGGPDHLFHEGAAFDDVLDLYVFDRALRLVVMDALERVEVAVRAAMTDHMSTAYADPHWYVDSANFGDIGKHTKLLRMVQRTCEEQLDRSPEQPSRTLDDGRRALAHPSALEHYLTTYGLPDLPPSWLMVETLTIGQLSSVYRNIKRSSDRTAIARSIGLPARLLESWMPTYVRVRNICAHHGRLWNVGLGVYPAIPNSRAVPWLEGEDALPSRSTRRLYPVLVSLQAVLDSVSPRSSWAQRLHALLHPRPPMNLAGMGVPEHWADDGFWRRHLA